MPFSEYGSSTGKPVVYFHGVPGAPSEAAVLHDYARLAGLRVLSFNRLTLPVCATPEAYYLQIATAIRKEIGNMPVAMIGFSIGSHVALATAAHLREQVTSLHLVSAVAPLQAGDFPNAMAGKAVFQLAHKQPWLFKLLARWQAFLAPRFPTALFRMLFASAQGQDQQLASQADFQQFIAGVFIDCFGQGVDGYCRDIQRYLAPWSPPAFTHSPQIHLWHGSEDNWSPLGMAEYLAGALPGAVLHRGEGLSHYSCLYDAVPKIVRHVG
ncbi:hypothetical protein GCM10017655_32250 [Pseudomonas turukhanskensis]|uniref:Alpha/beta hydrolase n=2 Tax=Pseudomonas turukhanskensis TaxID=1806536 RepID=A0A9W6NGK7_9PSED|nr:hypothetical protein GCM10017655_32250 [Pseudomonas turukhanskensis]